MEIANQELASNISIEAQDIKMAELGLKFKQEKFSLFVTPFYTLASNIPNLQTFQNPDVTYYAPPRVYQKNCTSGLELEGNVALNKNFSVRAVATVNTYGIMSWAAPDGFPASLDTQGF